MGGTGLTFFMLSSFLRSSPLSTSMTCVDTASAMLT